jgi:hypothetical protein
MTVEQFHAAAEYLALTQRQRKWVDTFTESQNPGFATSTAYGSDTTETYRAMFTRKLETNPRILPALDLYFARSEREKLLRDLEHDIPRLEGVALIEAYRLRARLAGPDADSTRSKPSKATTNMSNDPSVVKKLFPDYGFE